MSDEEKRAVHAEIDQRMNELESTGLSRTEILFDEPNKGIKLKDDPYFQLVKESHLVREMMVPAGALFSADLVIEAALRQDIGPDPSLSSGAKQNYQHASENTLEPIWEYKKKYRDKTPMLNEEAYFAGHNRAGRNERQAAFDKEKPATFINRPLTRSQIRKKFMRSMEKDDFDWRNTQMLSKFLNSSGKLYNRFQTRLDTSVHRRLAQTVRKSRSLGLLPYVGHVKPTDKISLGSYI